MKLTTLITLIALTIALTASAETLTVQNLNDAGPGSLRTLIDNANEGDLVEFTVNGTLALQSPITIKQSLTIRGPKAGLLAIDGNRQTRLFIVQGSQLQIEMSNLTLQNGYSAEQYGWGGALFVYGDRDQISLHDMIFSGNYSTQGGAIAITSPGRSDITLNVKNSIFVNNSTLSYGGAISLQGANLQVENSTFVSNSAGFGGAIDLQGGDSQILNSTMTKNNALRYGGAISTQGAFLKMTSVTVANNTSLAEGGGISIDGSQLTLTRNTIVGNSAPVYPDLRAKYVISNGYNVIGVANDLHGLQATDYIVTK